MAGPWIIFTQTRIVSKSLKVVIACGGTGGHLFPGIAVAETLQARGHEPLLLISQKKVDREASAKYRGLNFEAIEAVAKPKTFSPKMLPFLWKLWKTTRQCKRLLKEFGADAVLGMGGFTSLPPVLAGHRMGLKTFVHDSNARPGRANVLTSRFCNRVFLGMEAARPFFRQSEIVITGTPVRDEMVHLPSRAEGAEAFRLDPAKPVLLVMGGSQGAKRLNDLAAESAALFPANIQILHIAGTADLERVQQTVGNRDNYRVVGFCDKMALAYAASDLIIARSGASSLTEIAHAGLPSILVPYPYAADDHQTKNAVVFSGAGAAELVQECDLDAAKLAQLASGILNDLQTHGRMAQAARALDIPDASVRVCDAIEATLS
ncbi:MAG: undecaprenyldiphospho-muramoylpentapeptide beta-N-acetylglucosaminyltransferase [Verrucomicrobiales bacterium VVV1]|nr:MAG: undecaprenyldiphospho-muramoylpentapeptide beta-N-acetylglucosaminyltransferase [Verrucomicrobiales bacterium VVV1]